MKLADGTTKILCEYDNPETIEFVFSLMCEARALSKFRLIDNSGKVYRASKGWGSEAFNDGD